MGFSSTGGMDLSRRQSPAYLKGMMAVPGAAAALGHGMITSRGQIKGLIQSGGFPGASGQHMQSHLNHSRPVLQAAKGASAIKGLIQAGGIPGVPSGSRIRGVRQKWQ
jgi:hypothetical protein